MRQTLRCWVAPALTERYIAAPDPICSKHANCLAGAKREKQKLQWDINYLQNLLSIPLARFGAEAKVTKRICLPPATSNLLPRLPGMIVKASHFPISPQEFTISQKTGCRDCHTRSENIHRKRSFS